GAAAGTGSRMMRRAAKGRRSAGIAVYFGLIDASLILTHARRRTRHQEVEESLYGIATTIRRFQMNRRCQQRRGWFVTRHLLIGASLGLAGIQTSYADDGQSGAVRPGIAADCTSATELAFEGNTTITAATLVT